MERHSLGELDDFADHGGAPGPSSVARSGPCARHDRAQRAQVGNRAVNIGDAIVEEFEHRVAGLLVRALQLEDAADFIETESEALCLADERQNSEIVGTVRPVPGLVALWGSEQPAPLVQPDRLGGQSTSSGRFANGTV